MLISLVAVGAVSDAPTTTQPQSNFVAEKTFVKKSFVQVRQDRFDQTYPLAPNGRVSLSNINGEVVVEGWDRQEVRVEAVKTIDCEKPQDIEIEVDSNPSFIRIETDYSKDKNVVMQGGDKDAKTWSYGYDNRCRKLSVDYKLSVPRAAILDEVETVNGNVRLSGVTNSVKTSTVNGKVTAQDLRGSVNLSSVNGTLDVGFANLDNVRDVRISIVNGRVDLQLPSDAEAIMKASTVHGTINNDFGLPVRKGEYVGNDLHGKLGNGTIPIRLSSVNGTISIRRNQDGRQVKPATNLLSDRDEPDEMDEMDEARGAVRVKAPKAPKPPKPAKVKVAPAPAPGAVVVNPARVVNGVIEGINEVVTEEVKEQVRETMQRQREQRQMQRDAARAQADAAREIARAQIELQRELAEDLGERSFATTERKTATIAVEGAPNVNIEARNGAVRIRGWDKQEVSYSLIRPREENGVNISSEKKGSDVNLRIPAAADDFRLEVYVPRKSNLKIVSEREIRVEGVSGKLDLRGGDESIDVRESGGSLKVAARAGRVRVIGFNGDADVNTHDGEIALEGSFKVLNTTTVGGSTVLTLDDDASATLEATTKDVTFDGIAPKGEPRDTRNSTVWQIGESAGSSKFKLRTTAGGQVLIRSASSVRILKNFVPFVQIPLLTE
jgi:DUF4097 and DUF4098 domain-containing protein YvlB